MRKSSFFFLLLLVAASCKKETNFIGVVDPAFRPYVDQFVEEGARLGIDVDVSELSMQLVDILEGCGQAPDFLTQPRPQVLIESDCWEQSDEYQRELLVFHELGHAILKRSHLDERLPNNSYKSIMVSGRELYSLYNGFTLQKRAYYLEELFLRDVPVPDWAKAEKNSSLFRELPIDEYGSGWFFSHSFGVASSQVGKVVADGPAGNYVLKMSNQDANVLNSATWSYNILDPGFPVGDQLALSMRIRLEEVKGDLTVALRGENSEKKEVVFFISTEGVIPINGTTDGYVEMDLLNLDFFPESVDWMTVLLMMEKNTTGTVYFDDIRLIRKF